jgi:CBS domain containing-hemolysin-like protein
MMPSLFILLGALTASAFFSGMEIAFLSANRLQVEIEAKKGSVSGRLMPWFYRHSSSFIATMLLGNTLALVLVGNATAKLLNGPLDFLGSPFAVMAVQTMLSTVVVLVLAEYMPKPFSGSGPMNRSKRLRSSWPWCWLYFPPRCFFSRF